MAEAVFLDPTELRRAFTLYPRGVMAVAAQVDGAPVGLAVSAFVSVSLDPPLMLICIDRASTTWPKLENVPGLGVSVIAEDQSWLGRQLASRSSDRFAGADFQKQRSGALLLEGSAARFETSIEQTYDGGDHIMVLLRVLYMEAFLGVPPLVWHHSQFATVGRLDQSHLSVSPHP